MSRRRFLAIIMSVFMILSLLPATVFAETSKALDGQLKIQGLAAAGTVLSADLKGIKTEGVIEDSVSYEWFRKTPEDEKKEQQGEKPELKQLSKRRCGFKDCSYDYRTGRQGIQWQPDGNYGNCRRNGRSGRTESDEDRIEY